MYRNFNFLGILIWNFWFWFEIEILKLKNLKKIWKNLKLNLKFEILIWNLIEIFWPTQNLRHFHRNYVHHPVFIKKVGRSHETRAAGCILARLILGHRVLFNSTNKFRARYSVSPCITIITNQCVPSLCCVRSVRAFAHDADNVYNARYSWVWRNDSVLLCLLLLVLCSLWRISPFIKRRTIKRLIKRGNYTQTFASFRANCPFVKRVRVPSARTLIFILSFIFFSHYFLFRFTRFFSEAIPDQP